MTTDKTKALNNLLNDYKKYVRAYQIENTGLKEEIEDLKTEIKDLKKEN